MTPGMICALVVVSYLAGVVTVLGAAVWYFNRPRERFARPEHWRSPDA
jgi:hypothetical protein